MADISRELQAIMTAIYGEDVRGSIHNAIDLINRVGEKTLTVGTDVTSPSSSVSGYFKNSIYINTLTDDVWKCTGSEWVKVQNLKGEAVTVESSKAGNITTVIFKYADTGETIDTVTLLDGQSITASHEAIDTRSTKVIISDRDTGEEIDSFVITDGTPIDISSEKTGIRTTTVTFTEADTGEVIDTFEINDGKSITASHEKTGIRTTTVTITDADTEEEIDSFTISDGRSINVETEDISDGTRVKFLDADTEEVLESVDIINGTDGEDGDSITVESDKVGKITTVTIKDKKTGSVIDTFEIKDGADGLGTGDMSMSTYDTNENGIVDNAEGISDGKNTLSFKDISDAINSIPSDEDKAKWNKTPTDLEAHTESLVMSDDGVHGLRYNGSSLFAKDKEGTEHEIKTGGGSSQNGWVGTEEDWENDTGNVPKDSLVVDDSVTITDDEEQPTFINSENFKIDDGVLDLSDSVIEKLGAVSSEVETGLTIKSGEDSVTFNKEGKLHTNINGEELDIDLTTGGSGSGGGGGRNLIDNAWFTVNQRGQSEYSEVGYSVDRWKIMAANTKITVNSNGISIDTTEYTSGVLWVQQIIGDEVKNKLIGKTVTLSVLYNDGTLESATGTFGNESLRANNFRLQADGSFLGFRITDAMVLEVIAVKLELGSVSTLALDSPSNYAIELAKCRASTADPEDTYANQGNIAMLSDVGSNENLLDNPWFTVNQRELSQYSGAANMYTVDRWYVDSAYLKVNVDENGVKLNNTRSAHTIFKQKLGFTATKGIYTLSMLYKTDIKQKVYLQFRKNGVNISNGMSLSPEPSDNWQIHIITFEIPEDVLISDVCEIHIYPDYDYSGGVLSIRAVKLEHGSISTLANDVAPNYTSELQKCQRYFKRIKASNQDGIVGVALYNTSNISYVSIPISTPFRTKPSVSFKNMSDWTISVGSNRYVLSNTPSVEGMTENSVTVSVYHSSSASSYYGQVFTCSKPDSYIDLSADL